jgi:chemotaxis signal transduction protein
MRPERALPPQHTQKQKPRAPGTPALPHKGARENVILFNVAEFKFAIAAGAVSEIRSADGLERFSAAGRHRVLAKVDYTLQRNGVTFFVVNGAQHFGLASAKASRVLILRHSAAAVLVDSTDRMMEISLLHSLPMAFQGEERNWYRGLAVLNGEVLPVVNPAAFLSRGETAVLRALMETQPAQGVAVG